MKKEAGIAVIFVAVCIFVAIRSPAFLSTTNLQNTGRLIGIFGIMSLGVGVVIMSGGIDLSVGSLFALLGVILPILIIKYAWSWQLAVAAIMIGMMLIGAFHGLLITKLKLQPFIVTLSTLLLYRGLARYISGDETKGFGSKGLEFLRAAAVENLGGKKGVPYPFVILLVCAIILYVVLHRSVYGRYLMAIGRNEDAARYSGINTQRVVLSAYVICLALWGIAGILMAFYTNSIAASTHGTFYEAFAIAGAVLGGCSLRGGEGSVLGILIGAALLQVLQNLVNLVTIFGYNIPSSLNFAVIGGVILAGVMIDQVLQNRNKRKLTVALDLAAPGAAPPPAASR